MPISDAPVTRILGIESSCDETAVAVVSRAGAGERAVVEASVISSQIPLHREHGGVVPELASRNHSLRIEALVRQALADAGRSLLEIDCFAATSGPGLASSLLIGSTTAKALACALRRPYLAVNHLEGHLLSPFLASEEIPPHVALIISGGHTLLIDVAAPGAYVKLGGTRDDAAGEAFDKVGKMLGLEYPGGPEIERAARDGNPAAFDFPRSMLHDPHLDFSFSGLKTAVLYTLGKLPPPVPTSDVAASFQQAVIEVLVAKAERALHRSGRDLLAISGGVGINLALRAGFERSAAQHRYSLAITPREHCTDNAAMIAFAGLIRHERGEESPLDGDIEPNLPLVEAAPA